MCACVLVEQDLRVVVGLSCARAKLLDLRVCVHMCACVCVCAYVRMRVCMPVCVPVCVPVCWLNCARPACSGG